MDHGALPRGLAPPPAWRRRLGRVVGWLAVGLSFAFIAAQIDAGLDWSLVTRHWRQFGAAVAGGTVIYGLAGFLLAEAWRQLLGTERTARPPRHYHAVYGRTQIAKYLPGNCFHFAGRQWLGGALGHSQATLALASVAETVLLVAIAAVLALPLAGDRLSDPPRAAIVGALGALVLLALALLRHRLRLALRLACAGLLYALFFVIAGGVLSLLIRALGGEASAFQLSMTVPALALAWIAGFATPGAAAGIGVREAVLLLVLDEPLGTEVGLTVALALRLVTTCGDGLLFAFALLLRLPAERAVLSEDD